MKPVILAISPGTLLTGVALFRNDELVDWEVRSFQGPWNRQKQRKIDAYFQTLFRGTDITHVGVRIPAVVSPSLQWLLSQLQLRAKQRGIVVRSFPLFLLKEAYSPDGRGFNRKKLHEEIIRQEPELSESLPDSFRLKKDYYAKMIEAIGVGRAYQQVLTATP